MAAQSHNQWNSKLHMGFTIRLQVDVFVNSTLSIKMPWNLFRTYSPWVVLESFEAKHSCCLQSLICLTVSFAFIFQQFSIILHNLQQNNQTNRIAAKDSDMSIEDDENCYGKYVIFALRTCQLSMHAQAHIYIAHNCVLSNLSAGRK